MIELIIIYTGVIADHNLKNNATYRTHTLTLIDKYSQCPNKTTDTYIRYYVQE